MTLSSDNFYNYENSAKGIYPKGISRNTSMTSGHDDSTTTSGSYIIDEDDEYVDMVQPSKQCIVWCSAFWEKSKPLLFQRSHAKLTIKKT